MSEVAAWSDRPIAPLHECPGCLSWLQTDCSRRSVAIGSYGLGDLLALRV